jgi:subtilisin family serine protease
MISENFKDDKVIVSLTQEFSKVNNKIDVNYFSVSNIKKIMKDFNYEVIKNIRDLNLIGIESIRDLTYLEDPSVLKNSDKYIQILEITIKNKAKENVIKMVNILNTLSFVDSAEPSYIFHSNNDSNYEEIVHENQWSLLDENGINVGPVWDFIGYGETTPMIKVGIFEKSMELTHPDINVVQGNFNPDPSLEKTHGTIVASIIGAINNREGMIGVSQVQICLLDRTNFVSSISWAMNNGIKIINASYHTTISNENSKVAGPNNQDKNALKNYSNYGGVVIAAAGNINTNTDQNPQYPAGYADKTKFPDIDNVISVGAINEDGTKEISSNYGDNSVGI